MINGKGYYHFRHCENSLDLCARCCFSIKVGNDRRCDGPFPCESNSYYVRPEDFPVKIGNTIVNIDLPTPLEVGEELKAKEGEVAAQQRLTERSKEETDKAEKETDEAEKEPKEAGKETEEDGKAKKTGSIGKRSYYGFPNGVEAEDICRYLSFNLGNVVKYVCRAGRKDAKKKIEDLQKARDYLDNEIKRLEEGDE